ncbi:ZP domain-containing protein [Caerostris darwini]|uniref:ZP domain-containing protein n=1 Tax=Caerostris darwini TaxID=1538125 RepID=A0AAV4WJQ9_9ARAC|nr:ZP domain-containing protein [Caerostris darwini]
MEIFVPRTFERSKLICFVLVMMCSRVICIQDNVANLNSTCDLNGLHVQFTFPKPFEGIVFAFGHRSEPTCSTIPESPTLSESLTLPLTACGTVVEETDHPLVLNSIVVQYHRLLQTQYDYVEELSCRLTQNLSEQFWSSHNLDQTSQLNLQYQVEQSFHLKLDSQVMCEKVNGVTSCNKRLLIFRLHDGGIHEDLGIKQCIAHDAKVISENTLIYGIDIQRQCSEVTPKNAYNFNVVKVNKGLVAFVKIKAPEIKSVKLTYITCEVAVCKAACDCPKNKTSQVYYLTTVVSHKLLKKSGDSSSEISPQQRKRQNRKFENDIETEVHKVLKYNNQTKDIAKSQKRIWSWLDGRSSQDIDPSIKKFISESTELYNTYSYTSVFEYDDELESTEMPSTLTSSPGTYVTSFKELTNDSISEVDSTNKTTSTNETAENTELQISDFTTIINSSNEEKKDCVSRTSFVIMLVALIFVIVSALSFVIEVHSWLIFGKIRTMNNYVVNSNIVKSLVILYIITSVSGSIYPNPPTYGVECNDTTLTVHFNFSLPFGGAIFSDGEFFVRDCSLHQISDSNDTEFTIHFPFDKCTFTADRIDDQPAISIDVITQQHNLMATLYDYVQTFSCPVNESLHLLYSTTEGELPWSPERERSSYELRVDILAQLPLPGPIDEGMESRLFVVVLVRDRGLHKDLAVRNCIAHDQAVLSNTSSVFRLSDEFGCTDPSYPVPQFTVTNESLRMDLLAYASLGNFSHFFRGQMAITCGAVLCDTSCPIHCNRTEFPTPLFLTDVQTKVLVRRGDSAVPPESLDWLNTNNRRRQKRSSGEIFKQFPFMDDFPNELPSKIIGDVDILGSANDESDLVRVEKTSESILHETCSSK